VLDRDVDIVMARESMIAGRNVITGWTGSGHLPEGFKFTVWLISLKMYQKHDFKRKYFPFLRTVSDGKRIAAVLMCML